MADAARAAKGSFNDIKEGAGRMAGETGFKMSEARHGVMLLGEEFGVHMPRALTSFVAGLGPIGGAMEAAFPFLAIIVGATLLLEHLAKVREAAEQLAENQVKFGTTIQNTFNALDQKLLQAGIKADELNKNHLAALTKQLELIDRASMEELVKSFDAVSKAADVVFAELKSHWYTLGIGSAGAQHALTKFRTEYDSLLARGKNEEAADLLAGTRKSAERVLEMQKQYKANQLDATGKTNQGADYNKFEQAAMELKKAGVGLTEKEVQAQQALVDTLQAQAGVQQRVNALKELEGQAAKNHTTKEIDDDAYKRIKLEMEAEKQGIEAEDKLQEERYRAAVERIQQGEREKIEATESGTAARLAAIEAAIQEENNKGLQETGFYRALLVSRIGAFRQMTQEKTRIQAEAGRIAATHAQNMGELELAADREAANLRNSERRVSQQELLRQDTEFANREQALKIAAINREIAALDKTDKDFQNKLKTLNNKKEALEQAHQNKLTEIQDKATIARNTRMLAADDQMRNSIAQGLAGFLMRHQSFAAMMSNIGDQVATGMIQNAIKSMLALDMTKEKDAAAAARKAFNAGLSFGGIPGMILAPVLAAGAFATVMAFEQGGLVPNVPGGTMALLHKQEMVLPANIAEHIMNTAGKGGNGDTKNSFHTTITSLGSSEHLNKIVKKALDGHLRQMSRKKGLRLN